LLEKKKEKKKKKIREKKRKKPILLDGRFYPFLTVMQRGLIAISSLYQRNKKLL